MAVQSAQIKAKVRVCLKRTKLDSGLDLPEYAGTHIIVVVQTSIDGDIHTHSSKIKPGYRNFLGSAEDGGEIAYRKDRFSIDASAYVGGKVILQAGLKAMLYAEAGVWRFKVRTEKTWELAKYSLDTGLQLGIRMPLHYDSIDGFRMPSLSDITPEPATLDISPSNILSSLFTNAPSKERES